MYRSSVTITNNVAVGLSDYQVSITTNTKALYDAGMMQSGGADLRFTASDGTTLLPYWIETQSPNTATSCVIWVKVASLPASSNTTIYMYFGNSSASAASSGTDTFVVYDNCESDSWTFAGDGSKPTQWTGAYTTGSAYSTSHSYSLARTATGKAAVNQYAKYTRSLNVGSGSRKARIFVNDTYTTTNAGKRYKQLYVGSVNCLDEDISGGSSGWTGTGWVDITAASGSQNVYFQLYDKATAAFTCTVYWDDFMVRKSTVTEPTAVPSSNKEASPCPGSITSLTALQESMTSARLSWTAPGDNGYSGNVTGGQWDIRFTSVTTQTADTAQYAITRSSSYTQGATYTDIMTGLTGKTTWWFWIRARDGDANYSQWSASSSIFTSEFTDIGVNLPAVGSYSRISWGDYDNDGDLDLVLSGYMADTSYVTEIYRNDGGSFTDMNAGLTPVYEGMLSWGDYDSDGDLDLVVGGRAAAVADASTKLYRNDSGSFREISGAGLTGLCRGACSWGDYDNDGDLDLAVSGMSSASVISTILYRNDSGSFKEITGAGLPQIYYSSLSWGDYDNDGDLDLALAGSDASATRITRIYRNDGGSFVNSGAAPTGAGTSSLSWGDYDNDGDLDLAVAGYDSGTALSYTKLYRNDSGSFNAIAGAGLTGVGYASLSWGDYDNDGDLDLALAGEVEESVYISKIYRNNGNNTFTDIVENLTNMYRSFVSWGDYDNDGDLDLAAAGHTSTTPTMATKIYRNNCANANTAPAVPSSGLSSSYSQANGTLQLRWNRASDTETPEKGLYYELRVATETVTDNLAKWVISPTTGAGSGYDPGQRLGSYPHGYCVASSTQPGFNLSSLITGATYYWQVRTIDTGLGKSAWSDMQECCIKADNTAPGKITSLTGLAYNPTTARLAWTAPGDDGYTGNVSEGMWEIRFTSKTTETADTAQYNLLRSSSYTQGAMYTELVTGLTVNTSWWFWVRARDEGASWSAWSDMAVVFSTSSWAYRRPVPIYNGASETLYDFQVCITTNTKALYDAGMMQATGADLRFRHLDGTELPYWIETANPSTAVSCVIWVKITGTDGLPALSTTTICMYYGNPYATAISSGPMTFDVWEDFSKSFIDTSVWYTHVGNGGAISVTGGEIYHNNDTDYSGENHYTKYTFGKTAKRVIDFDIRYPTSYFSGGNWHLVYFFNPTVMTWGDATYDLPQSNASYISLGNLNSTTYDTRWRVTLLGNGSYNLERLSGTNYMADVINQGIVGWEYVIGPVCIDFNSATYGNNDTYWDDIRVRKYAIPMPTTTVTVTEIPFIDKEAPASVADLEATQGTLDGTIRLSWSAPGDDGMTGILVPWSRYAVQYSSWTEGVVWSSAAAQVVVTTSTVIPGTEVSGTVTGLIEGTTYYLRLWHRDEAGNWSGISSGATTWAQIDLTAPAKITMLVPVGGSPMKLAWTAPGEDNYDAGDVTGGAWQIHFTSRMVSGAGDAEYALVRSSNYVQGLRYEEPITGLTDDTTWYFWIRARDGHDHWSVWSDSISVRYIAWYNSSWAYRQPIQIYNGDTSALSDFQVEITTNTKAMYDAGKLLATGADLRFTKWDCVTELPYWIETADPSIATSCTIWVKATGTESLPALSTTTIYMYYGNPSAVAVSSGPLTFDVWDDFNDGFLNTGWSTHVRNGGAVSETGGELLHNNDADHSGSNTYTNLTFGKTGRWIIDFDLRYPSAYTGGGNYHGVHFFNTSDVTWTDTYYDMPGQSAYVSLGDLNSTTYDTRWRVTMYGNGYYSLTRLGGTNYMADVSNQPITNWEYLDEPMVIDFYSGNYGNHDSYWDDIRVRKHALVAPTIAFNAPPGQITGLTGLGAGEQIGLTWTAPGSDGASGDYTSALWRIAYSSRSTDTSDTAQFTWDVSTGTVTWGTQYNHVLTGLQTRATYWLWMKVQDDEDQWSVWSDSIAVVMTYQFEPSTITITGVDWGMLTWGDYDNDNDLDLAISGDIGTGYSTRIYRNDIGVDFFVLSAGLTGVQHGALSWGDYDLDGDLDLAMAGYDSATTQVTKIYRNNGNHTFTDIAAGLTGTGAGALAWGDYDGDGDLDLAVAGYTGAATSTATIYQNTGGAFTDINAGLTGVGASALAWGDYDNDGDLDIVLSGDIGSSTYQTKLYRNDSGGFVHISGASLQGVYNGALSWGDYDSDGDLDLLAAGEDGSSVYTIVYRNDGGGAFANINAGLTGVFNGAAVWGDYDNDGDMDIALGGYTNTGKAASTAKIYRNNGNNTFTEVDTQLISFYQGSLTWGNYDNDTDLDLAVGGSQDALAKVKIYINKCHMKNKAPDAPSTNLTATKNGGTLELRWDKASDNNPCKTPQNALYYEVRVATETITDGLAKWIISPSAGMVTGYGPGQNIGNYPHGYCTTGLQPGFNLAGVSASKTYYWQVRSIDASLKRSPWSSLQTYTPPAGPARKPRIWSIMY